MKRKKIDTILALVKSGESLDPMGAGFLAKEYRKIRAELNYQRRFVAFLAGELGYPAWSDLVAKWSKRKGD